ncbi:non-ribosomal peptide synthetase [Paenibacillus tyrfis]|uniref:Gramicidin synthetase n=1 Tax=Paenibacillus tyrfis TaxID=1501230 RepID=A0A081NUH9_9BACL|nr:non-ribosomal peptide synthetase [Paenibacillus tyrfis]KEQ22102.1 gramicidin synthetase [Paenibacillus tyrfis]
MTSQDSLEKRRSLLSDKKRALLGQMLQGTTSAASANSSGQHHIHVRQNKDKSRLSYAQQRLWFFSSLEPESAAYHLIYGMKLNGPLQAEVLERSLQALTDRHEVLRTVFRDDAGSAYQLVLDTMNLPLEQEDLRGLPLSEQEAAIQKKISLFNRPFDLRHGPLLRVTLLCLSENEHVLLLAFHHIITDGWSHHVFGKELLDFYHSFIRRETTRLPALRVQYADFAEWQRERFSERTLQEQLSYWKQRLAGAPALLSLPTDHPRPAQQQYSGRKVRFDVPEKLTASLRNLAAEEQATSFMLLMAAFQTLLHRYTGEEDVCVGTAISGRNHKDVESLIGFFVNTLVIRSEVTSNLPFRQLLRQVRKNALEAYAHQDVPFEIIVEETAGTRSLGYSPLFQVMFTLQNTPSISAEMPDFAIEPLEVDTETTLFDLTLEVFETNKDWKGILTYNQSLFGEATVRGMTEHLLMLLSSIADNPDTPIESLPILLESERNLLLHVWNRTKHEYPTDTTLHQMVKVQAANRPEQIAVRCENDILTYDTLVTRSEKLADQLRKLGIGPGSVTAICLERSPELVIAQLAVLIAGGAYLPIDPETPRERFAYILKDSLAPVLLTSQSLHTLVAEVDVTTLYMDKEEGTLTLHRTFTESSRPMIKELEGETAYVIYTSGSTGNPKGTMIPHASIANFMHWFKDVSALSPSDRVCFAVGVSFDMSVAEIWGALCCGASLWIPPQEIRLQPELLRDWMVENEITFAFLSTPLVELLVAIPWPAHASLSRLFTGGDKWNAKLPYGLPFEVYEVYGPTECTIVSTYRIIEPEERAHRPAHIGRPVANTTVYILDKKLQLAPIGVPGELCIGGRAVGGGYLHREALTNEKFIPDPYALQAGAQLYRSGDLARYLPDGRIQFLGRLDDQVKIRGFRIELGEIQAALAAHPSVKEAVVLVREDTPGDKRITAYVTGRANKAPDIEELRRTLRELLPDYMVPSAFVALDRLPLNTNGKINRQALPKPDAETISKNLSEEPRNDVEKLLCGILAELLSLDKVGIHQNYFEIGGDSIKTMMLISRVKQAGLSLTHKQVFQYQTVAELSRIVAESGSGVEEAQKENKTPRWNEPDFDFTLLTRNYGDFAKVCSLDPDEIEDVYPLTPLQDYMLATLRQNPEPAQFFVNMVMRFTDKLEPGLMTQAWQKVANHFALTKTSIFYEGLEVPVQVMRRNIRVAIHYPDWREWDKARQHEELMRYQELQLNASDLSYIKRPTTYEIMFARIGESEYQLVMSCSYLLMDGWSHFIVLAYVLKYYYSLLDRKPYELPPARQYREYVAWLHAQDLEQPMRYWRAELAGFHFATPLIEHAPLNRSSGESGFAKQFVEFEVPEPHLVKELVRRSGVTMSVLSQLAWALLLGRYTGQRDVLFGLMSTGRHPEFEGMEEIVGPTINTLPMRIRLSENENVLQLLQRVQEKQLLLTQYDYTPLRRIREWIGLAEDRTMFESYLIFQNLGSYFDIANWLGDADKIPLVNEYEKALAIFNSGTPLRVDISADSEGHFTIYMTYLKAHFRDESVGQMIADLKDTLIGICQAPEQTIDRWLKPADLFL